MIITNGTSNDVTVTVTDVSTNTPVNGLDNKVVTYGHYINVPTPNLKSYTVQASGTSSSSYGPFGDPGASLVIQESSNGSSDVYGKDLQQ